MNLNQTYINSHVNSFNLNLFLSSNLCDQLNTATFETQKPEYQITL